MFGASTCFSYVFFSFFSQNILFVYFGFWIFCVFCSGFRVLTMGMHMPRDLCSSADCQVPAMEGHTLLCCLWMLFSWVCFSSGRGEFHIKTLNQLSFTTDIKEPIGNLSFLPPVVQYCRCLLAEPLARSVNWPSWRRWLAPKCHWRPNKLLRRPQ